MATAPYKATLLAEVPVALQQPSSMESFHAFAPYATGGPLEIKVIYHLPACDTINEYIAVVKAAMQTAPGKYVDVLYSPLPHWQSRHPHLQHDDILSHLRMRGTPFSVLKYLIRPAGRTPPAMWGLI